MPTSNLWLALVPLAAVQLYLVWRRLLAYLRFFQQEGYENLRFLKWTRARSLTDPAFLVAVASAFLGPKFPLSIAILSFLVFLALALAQPDPRSTGKISLRLTDRAKRILITTFVVVVAVWGGLLSVNPAEPVRTGFVASSAVFLLLPVLLLVGNTLLMPYEQLVQRRFEQDAKRLISDVHPFIVGITGSYGKSSTKSMLAHFLRFKGPTLAASGSINTLMGVTRHIRENLVPGDQFMVVEMGAFRVGSIRRLCQLTPPSAGIITAVGEMHLERFGSTEEIVRAKSELAQALPPGSFLVANADSPGALRIARGATHCKVLLYGETSSQTLDTRLKDVVFTSKGTSFRLETREAEYSCFVPLLGRPIILNLAGAFTLAVRMGMSPALVIAAMTTLRPVANRLEVVEEDGITWVRDAYNSNPIGFRAALEVAAALPVSRRILVTPGVVELGPEQVEANRKLAAEAAAVCDFTVVVSDTNRSAFEAGHRDAGKPGTLVPVETRTEAFRWLRDRLRSGDSVILENDLPDLYESSQGIFLNARPRRPSVEKAQV